MNGSIQLSGSPLDYLLVFAAGLALSFTPCVYPLIPVTVGSIGITAGGSKRRGFLLSFLYVTGIALTYSVMGVIAALTHRLFGSFAAHPATRLVVGAVFILFGLSMFSVFSLRIPGMLRASAPERKSVLSIFVLGLSSGLIASPCIAPALGAILVYIGTTGRVLYGATLLMVFAYGLGAVLIAVGSFSALLLNLPKSGKWMVWVERASGAVMLAIGIYFVIDGIRRLQ